MSLKSSHSQASIVLAPVCAATVLILTDGDLLAASGAAFGCGIVGRSVTPDLDLYEAQLPLGAEVASIFAWALFGLLFVAEMVQR